MPKLSPDFHTWMTQVQTRTEVTLLSYLPALTTPPTRLHQAMHYATLGGGKRIRPLLTLAAGELFSAQEDALYRLAAAIEMIHVYSLVHDDMPAMDNDVLRRGKPTVHIQFDEATALLVGDALQAQAFMTIANENPPRATTISHLQLLAQATSSFGMCGGQAIDLDSVGKTLDLNALEHMHQLKTGALLTAAVILGATCDAPLNTTETQALHRYTQAIGLAFQIQDDILDATSDSNTLGKTAGKDALQEKPTYVSILGIEASRHRLHTLLQEALCALNLFGTRAARLKDIAYFIVQREA